jgi:sugar lactone lactonase YvrE
LPGLQLALDDLSAATAAPTGGVWLATGTSDTQPGGTLLRLDAAGVVVRAVDLPPELATLKEQPVELTGPVTALAQARDGALWALQNHALWRLEAPDGGAPPGARKVVWHEPEASFDQAFASLLAMEDGSVLLATSDAQLGPATRGAYVAGHQHLVRRIYPDGRAAVFAGAGAPEPDRPDASEDGVALEAAHFNRPTGLALDRDGSVLVADMGHGLVRRLDPTGGRVTVVAGRRDAATVLARDAALDQPRGIAFDPQGRLLVTESGSHTLRRLEDRRLVRLAGGVQGVAGDGGPAQASALDRPFELAVAGDAVFLVEGGGHLLRRYSPASGLIETVAGGGATPLAAAGPQPRAREVGGFRITALALDQGGRPVFSAVPVEEREASFLGSSLGSLSATLWRVEADGLLTHLGGDGSLGLGQALDGQPAREVGLGFVAGLAAGPAGDLFLAEPMRGAVWRLDAQGGLHHVGGRQGLLVPDFTSPQQADMPAAEATLVCPVGLACDAAGNVYVAEAGTLGFERVVTAVGLRLSFESPGPGRVRCLTPDGRARILAGAGATGELAEVDTPIAVAANASGRVVFIDHGTGQLRELVAGP